MENAGILDCLLAERGGAGCAGRMDQDRHYRGRIAPTPSGYLHLGHARTFWIAGERASGGILILRNEDLDADRCRPEYTEAMVEDLRWFGFNWEEGPDVGGPYGPYEQSGRNHFYLHAWGMLQDLGYIYPSPHSRRDVTEALRAPHGPDTEPVFPKELRPAPGSWRPTGDPGEMNWRFRVRDGEAITFVDGRVGETTFVAGRDFGDFLVWRKDGFPSYDLAVAVDDHAMLITEVVRGEDLLLATARQLLLFRALGWASPQYYHVPLLCDANGTRLAKRHDALSLRRLREEGCSPEQLRGEFFKEAK